MSSVRLRALGVKRGVIYVRTRVRVLEKAVAVKRDQRTLMPIEY